MSQQFVEITEEVYKKYLSTLAAEYNVRLHIIAGIKGSADEIISFLPCDESDMVNNILLKSTQTRMLINNNWKYKNVYFMSNKLIALALEKFDRKVIKNALERKNDN